MSSGTSADRTVDAPTASPSAWMASPSPSTTWSASTRRSNPRPDEQARAPPGTFPAKSSPRAESRKKDQEKRSDMEGSASNSPFRDMRTARPEGPRGRAVRSPGFRNVPARKPGIQVPMPKSYKGTVEIRSIVAGFTELAAGAPPGSTNPRHHLHAADARRAALRLRDDVHGGGEGRGGGGDRARSGRRRWEPTVSTFVSAARRPHGGLRRDGRGPPGGRRQARQDAGAAHDGAEDAEGSRKGLATRAARHCARPRAEEGHQGRGARRPRRRLRPRRRPAASPAAAVPASGSDRRRRGKASATPVAVPLAHLFARSPAGMRRSSVSRGALGLRANVPALLVPHGRRGSRSSRSRRRPSDR